MARRFDWARLAMALVMILALAACDRGSTASVPIESWCVQLESALRDRHLACGCAGEPLDDDALLARCAGLDARSLLAAEQAGDVLWNGALATSVLASLEGCERAELLADPVIGEIALGEPCRIFEDTAGAPDDCVFGTICGVSEDDGTLRCLPRDAQCESSSECEGGECQGGECVTPVCAVLP